MKHLLVAAAALLTLASPAFAIDPSPEVIAHTYKSSKPLHIDDVAALMRQAEVWCYREDAGSCDWTEIYLNVADGPGGVVYETSNVWNAETIVTFVDKAQWAENRLCEYDFDKVPSTRATNRADGSALSGRALDALRTEVMATLDTSVTYCFDYLFMAYDPEAQTMALRQREYVDGVLDDTLDAEITLHFNAADVAALTLRDD